jgi:hypothetical protein
MTSISYKFYIERENFYDLCELKFDAQGAMDYAEQLQGAQVQAGDTGMLRSMINSAIEKIAAFRGVSDEETQNIIDMSLNLFEAIPLILQDLIRCRTGTQVVGTMLRAYKLITRMNIISSAFNASVWILDKLKEFTWDQFADENRSHAVAPILQTEEDSVLQSGDFEWVVSGARYVLNGYKDIKSSQVVKKLHQLLQYFLSFGLFQSFGLKFENFQYTEYDVKKTKKEHTSVEGFIYTLLDTVVWCLERGMQAVKLGSFIPFFHSSENYTRWADSAHRLVEDSHKMGSADVLLCPQARFHTPEEKKECEACTKFGELDEHSFSKRLETALADGDAILKYASDKQEKTLVKHMMSELRLIEARFLSKDRAQRDRKPPFSLLVFGESCVAKTMFMNICFMQYAKVHGKDGGAECMWTRNPLDKFYSGFKASKWCIRIDDIAMFNSDATPLDPSIADVILLSNGVSFVAPMAECDEKGVVPVRPELLLASTNTEHLNAHCYFSYPLAVRRRFPYVVELSIQDQYKVQGTSMLDPNTVDVDPSEYQNIWNIKLKKFKIVQDSVANGQPPPPPRPDFDTVGEWTDIYEFLAIYSKLTIEHKKNQTKAESTVEFMRQIPCCSTCFMPPQRCHCNDEIQTGEVERRQASIPRSRQLSPLEPISVPAFSPEDSDVEIDGDFAITQREHDLDPRAATYLERRLTEYLNGEQTDRDYFALLDTFRLFSRSVVDPMPHHMVSMAESESAEEQFYDSDDGYSDEDYNRMVEDRRSWLNKSMDWVDDQACLVKTIASAMAAGISSSCWNVTDRLLAQASDLVVFYQWKKVKLLMASAGQRIYDTFCNPNVVAFCSFVLSFAVSYFATTALLKALGVTDTLNEYAEKKAEEKKIVAMTKSEKIDYLKTAVDEKLAKDRISLELRFRESLREDLYHDEVLGQTQGMEDFRKDEKPNPWVKDEIILSEFQVAAKSRGWVNMSLDQIYERLRANVVRVAFEFENEKGVFHKPATAMCVVGHIYMTNNHCIPEYENMKCVLTQEPNTGNVGKNVEFSIDQKDILRCPERDLAFFWCILPPKMDTSELFLKQAAPGLVCGGFYIHCKKNEAPTRNMLRAIKCEESFVPAPVSQTNQVYFGVPDELTIKGDCGSPMVGMTPMGPVILGIHQQLRGDKVGAVQVLKTDIDKIVEYFGSQVQCGAPNLKDKLVSLHHKSVLRWPNRGQAHVYGSTPGSSFRASPKSRVRATIIRMAAERQGFKTRCGPPEMKGPEVWAKNVEPTLTQTYKFNKRILSDCVDGYVKDVLAGLKPEDLAEMIKLDDKTTMNGYPGVKFIDKIKRQTSMGYPHRKPKTNFLLPCEEDGIYQDAVTYTEEIWEEINLIRDVYSRGERYMPVFVMSLKDEPIPYAKIAIKKTRGFMGGPAAWQFVYRQQLLSFVRVFQLHPFLFEGAPGMNVNSCQWKHLYLYLTMFGSDRCIAGDYAKFDKRMSPLIILAAFDIIIAILRAAGRPEEDILAIKCMAHDVAYPLTNVQGDFVEFFGSNPSGHALTVIINCLANSIYMRYCYHVLNVLNECLSFKQHVALITYGDDNAQGVSDLIPWYNHTAISNLLAQFDVVYTMADKESESVPYISIDQVTFLKRSFVIDGDKVRCPLERASIDKMLTTCVASTSVCPEEQAVQAMRSACGEMFQYGCAEYETGMKKLHAIVKECDLSAYAGKGFFPTYEQLEQAYADATDLCDVCGSVARL